ncbi:MAG: hypothetical protein WBA91_11560 [Paracoccaceae bacterium]
MADPAAANGTFNILCILQAGRLAYEALIFAASFRLTNPDFRGRLIMAEPQPGPLWNDDPRAATAIRDELTAMGVEILPFSSEVFGQDYPNGNKIEGLSVLPPDQPFVFFDSDTLFTGAIDSVGFDFARPAASMRREATWPTAPLYGPDRGGIWKALYDRFGLDFDHTVDPAYPADHWQRYMYFNAGWFFYKDPVLFGQRFLHYARAIRDEEMEALASQTLFPWLDQIALPLVIQSLGGGRPGPELNGLDGAVTCHYRAIPLLYARECDQVVAVLEEATAPNRLKKILKDHAPMKRLVYQGKGAEIRAMFDRNALPKREQAIRNRIKSAGLWLR